MRPFPEASKLQFFAGLRLDSICIGEYVMSFSFDDASGVSNLVNITVNGLLEHVDDGGTARSHNTDETRQAPLCLHRLVGQSVEAVRAEPFRLTLVFDRGDRLNVSSEEGPYECALITDSEGQLHVF